MNQSRWTGSRRAGRRLWARGVFSLLRGTPWRPASSPLGRLARAARKSTTPTFERRGAGSAHHGLGRFAPRFLHVNRHCDRTIMKPSRKGGPGDPTRKGGPARAPAFWHKQPNGNTTFSNGCLGSHNDEERSEMRYVMRIAKPCESSKF